jgi:dipeptidyl aminopeptidase/acylaminoacyl peptidase
VQIGGAETGSDQAGLSADEALLCVEHAEHGDSLHPALRVIDPRSGEVVAEENDGDRLGLQAVAWSPIPGDERLAIVHEREGFARPAIWDLVTGERRDLRIDVPGEVTPCDWWPDGSGLLLSQLHEGRDRLLRLDLASGQIEPLPHPEGAISAARVRPDGRLWLRISSGERESRVLSDTGEEVIVPDGPRAPAGRPFESWTFTNPNGQRVHGFYVTPPGAGPFPIFMEVHGGPTWLYQDTWLPHVQALVDQGFAVGMVNYRGSTGYGAEWRDTLIGNIGFPEVEDVVAGMGDLAERGIADPSRAVVGGYSWGGYITLLALGLHPDRWSAGVAGVPVGDYAASYDDSAPSLQAYDRSLLGGTPGEVPNLMRERSPIVYVDRVRAPVLVLAAENDSRCPIRQIENYVNALTSAGGRVEVYRYETGHSSFVVDEDVRQTRVTLEFLEKHVGLSAPAL